MVSDQTYIIAKLEDDRFIQLDKITADDYKQAEDIYCQLSGAPEDKVFCIGVEAEDKSKTFIIQRYAGMVFINEIENLIHPVVVVDESYTPLL